MVDSFLRFMTSLPLESWLGFQCQAWFLSYLMVLSPIRQLLLAINNVKTIMHAYLATLVITLAHRSFTLVELFTSFPFLAACTAFSGTMEARLQL